MRSEFFIILIFLLSFQKNYANGDRRDEIRKIKNFADGIVSSANHQHVVMTEDLRSTAFGIKNTVTNEWAVRLDNAHKNVNFAHININKKLTGIKDPHIPIPQEVVDVAGKVTECAQFLKDAAPYVATAIETVQIAGAAYDDLDNMRKGERYVPKETIVTGSSIAGGWYGASFGGSSGSYIGGMIGLGVGSIFGPVVAIPLQAVGSVVGGVTGAVLGANTGRDAAETVARTVL